MAFPTGFTNAQDTITEIIAAHINNLEIKVGIDSDTNVNSLDYKVIHVAAGLTTQIQFNDGSNILGGDAGFVFDKTTKKVSIDKDAIGAVVDAAGLDLVNATASTGPTVSQWSPMLRFKGSNWGGAEAAVSKPVEWAIAATPGSSAGAASRRLSIYDLSGYGRVRTVSLVAGGLGYTAGDVLNLVQADNAMSLFWVTAVTVDGSGAVTSISINYVGLTSNDNYTTGVKATTPYSGSMAGSGCTVNVTAIYQQLFRFNASYPSFYINPDNGPWQILLQPGQIHTTDGFFTGPFLRFGNSISSIYLRYTRGSHTFGSDKFVISGGSPTEVAFLTIDRASGNVGIGTTAPSQRLDVNVGSADDGVRVISTSSGTAFGFTVAYAAANPYGGLYGNGSDNGISLISKYPSNNGPIKLIFSGGAAGTAATALVINPTAEHAVSFTGSQAGKTTLGDARRLLLKDSDGSNANRTEIGFGYAATYQPVVIGHKETNDAGQTAGTFYIATRELTTDSVPLERLTVLANGYVGIGTTSPTALLDINSDILRLRTAKTPASAAAAGNAGDICWDADYIYVCVAANTWKRGSIATW